MSHNRSLRADLTLKTGKVIGRKKEIERLGKYLHARGDRNYVYYWADGGLGKTRILEELRIMTDEAGPGFYFSGIIDLYHTDTHSTSDVERAIVEGLDSEKKYFVEYRQEREQFTKLRERGADPTVLEQHRRKLSGFFVDGFREMALEARKLVLCFDTVELLQYESSLVEEKAGLDTIDTRLKPWLLTNLKDLRNVLVVFSGRPKKQPPDEIGNLQKRFIDDLQAAFGEKLDIVELPPFDLKETRLLISELTGRDDLIPDEYFPIVHRLTRGRPIFIHLLVDLLMYLSIEPARIFQMFDKYMDLANVPDDDERLKDARDKIETAIFRALFYETGYKGEYLLNIALMPKGVDPGVLNKSIGMPEDQGALLLSELEPLSFTKQYAEIAGAEKLHEKRIFLHDEMYRLLTTPEFLPTLFIRERTVANALIINYYTPVISKLEDEIRALPPDERIALRERLHKFQTERLYYMMVQDPIEGYAEYKRLSEQANKYRWVGFGMRLLDEFLRFYNELERRKRFRNASISDEQIIRESAQLWVERFYEWQWRVRTDKFASFVLENPGDFCIGIEEHLPIVCNICSLWVDTRGVLNGYEAEVVGKAESYLDQLPPLIECTPGQTLARARLLNAIGYQYRLGGDLTKATAYYRQAKGAYRRTDKPDELATLLTNLSFANAKQGYMKLAFPLAFEALRINEEIEDIYRTGLALSTLAAIFQLRGHHAKAIEYGEEALQLFRELDDAHGQSLAYLSIVSAKRGKAKHALEKGRKHKLGQAKQDLEDALREVKKAIDIAENADLQADILPLKSELGRVYRDMGHVTTALEGKEDALDYYRHSERALAEALQYSEWSDSDKADTLQDLAEVLFFSGGIDVAKEKIEEAKRLLEATADVPAGVFTQTKYAPLGKLEMLRGQMAFHEGNYSEGLKRYVHAHMYFWRFSPNAIGADTMIEYLYKSLRELIPEDKDFLVRETSDWIDKNNFGSEASDFIKTLEELLGM